MTGSRLGTEYEPDPDEVTVIAALVPTLVIVTFAFGTTAPVGSKTVPVMPPRFVWAERKMTQDRSAAEKRRKCMELPLVRHRFSHGAKTNTREWLAGFDVYHDKTVSGRFNGPSLRVCRC